MMRSIYELAIFTYAWLHLLLIFFTLIKLRLSVKHAGLLEVKIIKL